MTLDIAALKIIGIQSSDGDGRKVINLPEVPKDECTVMDLSMRLMRGEDLVGWFCLEPINGDPIDELIMYRVEDEFLCRCRLFISSDEFEPRLKPLDLRFMNPDAMQRLFDCEISAFGHIYYDDQHALDDIPMLMHNVRTNEIKEYLKHHSVFIIENDRFLLKEDFPEA